MEEYRPHSWTKPPQSEAEGASRASGTARIVIERLYPELEGGRYPVKRVVGDRFEVWCDIFRDGHEVLGASLLYRSVAAPSWTAAPMQLFDNDRWTGAFVLTGLGRVEYTIEAWTDLFASWRGRILRKRAAGQDVALDLEEGRQLAAAAAAKFKRRGPPPVDETELLLSEEFAAFMIEQGPRADITRLAPAREIIVDRAEARFSAWYEMFPRSQGRIPGRSATFADCIARLDEIAELGFDTVYLPPIHPIGTVHRKGPNNTLAARPNDPGSPYAIGSAAGGHDAIDPNLGTLDDFRSFVRACRERRMEVALDLAVQCAPDHPWVKEHPEWFVFRADGSIRYAENPPKQYQDIVNLNFDSDAAAAIWEAIRGIVAFWIEQGVRVFRVDNPHTKPLPFWEWLIRTIQADHPEVIFLAEAFTRPKLMQGLAKIGFTQSYTYFTWRNEKQELIAYFTELTGDEPKEYFRPHLFTNTPDILPVFLQQGGPPAFRIRAILAATIAGLFGIYNGFELCENRALPNSEEYADSEKYQYKVWDWDRAGNIKPLIAALNRIRRANAAFRNWLNLIFLPCDNERMMFYSRGNEVFIALSLDPSAAQDAEIALPLSSLDIAEHEDIALDDLLSGQTIHRVGSRQRIRLTPDAPGLIFKVRQLQ